MQKVWLNYHCMLVLESKGYVTWRETENKTRIRHRGLTHTTDVKLLSEVHAQRADCKCHWLDITYPLGSPPEVATKLWKAHSPRTYKEKGKKVSHEHLVPSEANVREAFFSERAVSLLLQIWRVTLWSRSLEFSSKRWRTEISNRSLNLPAKITSGITEIKIVLNKISHQNFVVRLHLVTDQKIHRYIFSSMVFGFGSRNKQNLMCTQIISVSAGLERCWKATWQNSSLFCILLLSRLRKAPACLPRSKNEGVTT